MSSSATHAVSRTRCYVSVVVVALINFFEVGILKSYGVIFIDITRDLATSTTLVGTAIGISFGIAYIFAFVSVQLMRHFSIRSVVVVGSLIGIIGFISSSFSKDGSQFIVALLVSGIGNSLVFYPASVSLLMIFPDNFPVVLGIAKCGGGIGMMALPVLMEKLRVIYGWRGAVLIIGGLGLNCVACGCLLPTESIAVSSSDSPAEASSSSDPLGREEMRGSGSKRGTDIKERAKHLRDVLGAFGNYLHLDLFLEFPWFICEVMSSSMTGLAYNAWVVYVVPNALAKGHPLSRAVFLSTVGGAANIVGRITTGLVSKTEYISDIALFSLLNTVAAVAFSLNICTSSFLVLCFLSCANGYVVGSFSVIISYLPKSYVSPEVMVIAMYFSTAAFGLGAPAGGALMGSLYEISGSFNTGFFVAAAIHVTVIIVSTLPFSFGILQRIFGELRLHSASRNQLQSISPFRVQMQSISPDTEPSYVQTGTQCQGLNN